MRVSMVAIFWLLINLTNQLALAQSFADTKCAIPQTIHALNEMDRENHQELFRYQQKLKKLEGKTQLTTRELSKKRNMLAFQTQLEKEIKVTKKVLSDCWREQKELTEKIFKSKGSSCLTQYKEQIANFDAARTRIFNLINVDLDSFETPSSNQGWFSRALEISKSIAKGALICLYIQSAMGLTPAADKSGLIKGTSDPAVAPPSNSSALSVFKPSPSVRPAFNTSLLDLGKIAPLDKTQKHRPVTGFDLLLGGEPRGTTYIEPWIEQSSKAVVKEALQLDQELDAGILPKSVEPALQTMKSSIATLLNEWLKRDPEAANEASTVAADLSNRISEYLEDKKLPPNEIYLEFSQFASKAKGQKAPDALYESQFYAAVLGREPKEALAYYRSVAEGPAVDTIITHFLPEFSPLSIMDINRLQGLRIFPLGLTLDRSVEYDDLVSDAAEFTLHDFDHGFKQMKTYEDSYAYLRTRMNDNKLIDAAFSDTQQAYRDFMGPIHRENKHLAMGIESVFFYLTHELAAPIEPLYFMSSLSQNLLPLARNSKIYRRRFLELKGLLEDYAGVLLSADDFKEILEKLNGFFSMQMERFGHNPKDQSFGLGFFERAQTFLESKNINWSSQTVDTSVKILVSSLTSTLAPYEDGKLRSLESVMDQVSIQPPANPEEREPFEKMKKELIAFLKNEIALRDSGKSTH